MYPQIVFIDEANERARLVVQALRANGYDVKTLKPGDHQTLQASLGHFKPDFLVIGDEVVIDLKGRTGA